ncbi:hypothetical protein A15D_02619 [Alcanivorax sp. MD8A]|nr:hypothetical protein A15D_02619 [Alcanivorax sp. MD8A]
MMAGVKHQRKMEVRGVNKPITAYILCLYLVGAAIYSLAGLSWSAPPALLTMAVIYQLLRLTAGAALFFRFGIAPYLLVVVLLWSVVATLQGYSVHPLSHQSIYVIIYTVVSIVFLASIALYSFHLKRKGYFLGGKGS